MPLYFQHFPDPAADQHGTHDGSIDYPAVILPGLFGSTVNWRSFARLISQYTEVYVLDNRNHGRSPHFETHRYHDMASDLLAFLDRKNIDKIVLIGHSMGGKAAMVFSLLHPTRVLKLCVLDISPVDYAHSHTPILSALQAVDLGTLASRSQAERLLKETIPDDSTRLFLLQNLTGKPGEYRWRINIPVLNAFMEEITGFPDKLLNNKVYSGPTQVLFGRQSDYVLSEHRSSFGRYFSDIAYEGIEGAGHWLHADQPDKVHDSIYLFLKRGDEDQK